MAIEEYLRGQLRGWEIPDGTMSVFLYKRAVLAGTEVGELDERVVDLLTADMYLWMSMPGKRGTTTDKDGDWSHSETGDESTQGDRAWFRTMAENLYAKWGEEMPRVTSKITITGWGMSQGRRRRWP